ncbi:MAG: CvpA family protein [Nitrosomonadaceae bacterium]|jgi:membrane protein required for colicin V production|nr:CvpA family protein [Nitrosomonadaceae bacterium]MCK5715549.1 CvpA family protein [Nitrosomonadaceae bacterium]NOQ49060.1 CvpA family protein [Nitrosomonadaceae bacterium]
MTIFDFVVLIIFVVSISISVVRGIVRESLSLAGWVIAYMVAKAFAKDFVSMLPLSITGDSLRVLISFSALFLSVLLVMSLITILASALVKTVGLGSVDRLFGAFFGLARGLLAVLLLVLLAGLTTLPQEPFWQKALLSKPLEAGVIMTMPWLPQDLSKRINYGN